MKKFGGEYKDEVVKGVGFVRGLFAMVPSSMGLFETLQHVLVDCHSALQVICLAFGIAKSIQGEIGSLKHKGMSRHLIY